MEKNLTIKVELEALVAAGQMVYEMVFDASTGNWELVVMQDAERNIVGVAEFTQSNPPAKRA